MYFMMVFRKVNTRPAMAIQIMPRMAGVRARASTVSRACQRRPAVRPDAVCQSFGLIRDVPASAFGRVVDPGSVGHLGAEFGQAAIQHVDHAVDLGAQYNGYICDTGHMVAFTQGLSYTVNKVGGMKSLFLSGEGLVCTFKGQGRLWMQTRNPGGLASFLHPFRPVKSRQN